MSRDGGGPGRSHWWPRTSAGRIALIWFLASMALAQPPVVYRIANRIHPLLLGMPFLYVWLLAAYVSMISALVWAYRHRL